MKRLKDMRIKRKMVLLGVISIAGVLMLGTVASMTTNRVSEISKQISEYWLPSVMIPAELNRKASDYRIRESYYLMTDSEEERKALEPELDSLRREIEEGMQEYRQYAVTEESEAALKEAQELWDGYMNCSRMMLAVCRADDKDSQLGELFSQSAELYEDGSNKLMEIVEYNKQGAEKIGSEEGDSYQRLIFLRIAIILVIAVLVSWLVRHILWCVMKPLEQILDATRKLTSGDLNVTINYRSKDEMGELSKSINDMAVRLKTIVDDQKELVSEIADGNYDVRSQSQGAYCGDFAPLLYGLKNLISRLQYKEEAREDGGRKMDITDQKG